jgi:programmed cell death 6-interacting protein
VVLLDCQHLTVKQYHFEAAAQYRLSQEDLEKSRYGEEIARLRVAEGLTKKGIDAGRRGVADSVVQETKVGRLGRLES